jgi:ketosteroid isomerase-like protein
MLSQNGRMNEIHTFLKSCHALLRVPEDTVLYMTPEENKKLMQEIFTALARGESSLFVRSLAEDVTMRVTGQYTWSKTFRGKRELLTGLYGYLRTLLDGPGATIAERFIADGDHVVVEARGDMVTRDGVPYRNEYCYVYRLRDGMIVEIREYCDSIMCETVLGPFAPTPPLPDTTVLA